MFIKSFQEVIATIEFKNNSLKFDKMLYCFIFESLGGLEKGRGVGLTIYNMKLKRNDLRAESVECTSLSL